MEGLIIVLMSVYKNDNPNHLNLAIRSILGQTYQNFKFLIGVDGPVSDDIKDTLRQYEKEERIWLHWFPVNRGLTCVLNDLIDLGRYYAPSYWARMDADDISLPKRFALQTAYLNQKPGIDVVGGAIAEMDFGGILNGKEIHYPLSAEECKDFFASRTPVAHPAVMMRGDFFKKVKGYRPQYKKDQDTMLWFDAYKAGCQIANVPEVILHFRISDDLLKRRGGFTFSKQQLKCRLLINKELKYGLKADLAAWALFFLRISPTWLMRYAYKVLR